jgi:hypothetical protein
LAVPSRHRAARRSLGLNTSLSPSALTALSGYSGQGGRFPSTGRAPPLPALSAQQARAPAPTLQKLRLRRKFSASVGSVSSDRLDDSNMTRDRGEAVGQPLRVSLRLGSVVGRLSFLLGVAAHTEQPEDRE